MKIGFASAVSLKRLSHLVSDGDRLPATFSFNPASDWAAELVRRGHEVVVYTTGFGMQGPQTFQGEKLTIRIAAQRSRGTGRDFFAPERRQLTDLMKEDRCDIIHAHWTYEFALAALATKLPTLVTIHDLPWNVLRYFRDPYRIVRLLMAYEVALRGRNFTAVSQDAANHFRRYMRPGARIDVVPNGLPDQFFDLGNEPVSRHPDTFTYATILQGWSERKNGAAALRAFGLLRRATSGLRLIMFGEGYGEGEEAQKWAVSQGLDQDVTFGGLTPYGELLEKVRSQVDVLVHPSLDESFSMAALESMALRKPVIAGKSTPGVREVLGYGMAGVLTDVRKPEALAEAMRRLSTDESLYASITSAAYDRASTLYRTSAVMAQYEGLYMRLLGC